MCLKNIKGIFSPSDNKKSCIANMLSVIEQVVTAAVHSLQTHISRPWPTGGSMSNAQTKHPNLVLTHYAAYLMSCNI